MLFRLCLAFLFGLATSPWTQPSEPLLALMGGTLMLYAAVRGWGGWCGYLLAAWLGSVRFAAVEQGPAVRGYVCVYGQKIGSSQGSLVTARVLRLVGGQAHLPQHGPIQVKFPKPSPAHRFFVCGTATGLASQSLPGRPDPVRAAQLAGVRSRLLVQKTIYVDKLPIPKSLDDTGVLSAVSRGDRTHLRPHIQRRLRRTGTSHLLAISGFHVGVVGAVVAGLWSYLLRVSILIRPFGVPTSSAWAVGALAGWSYALFAGAPVSAQRAAMLLTLGACARLLGRKTPPLRSLALAAVLIATVQPSALASPSMQLSFGAVVGLVRLLPHWQDHKLRHALPRGCRWLTDSAAISIASTIGTLPAAAWWFQDIAPLAPLANLLAVPLFTFVIVPCAALAEVPYPEIAGIGQSLGSTAVWVLHNSLAPFDVAPWHPTVSAGGALVLAVALYFLCKFPGCGLVLAGCTLNLRERPKDWQLMVFDVGQGSAALITDPWGDATLIDTGPNRGVAQYLAQEKISLKRLILTHGDYDHVGGALAVLEKTKVEELWIGSKAGVQDVMAEALRRAVPVVERPSGIYWPLEAPKDERGSRNDHSIAMVLGPQSTPILITGDVGASVEREFAHLVPNASLAIIGHHGSDTSTSQALLDTGIRGAIISAGRDNRYDHPSPHVTQRLKDARIDTHRTDLTGTLAMNIRYGTCKSFLAGHGWSRTGACFSRPMEE